MNTRERFYKVMHWQKPDRVPNMDFGYWEQTITQWHKQGLPENLKNDIDIEHYFGLEGTESIPNVPVINGLFPAFEQKILEDKGNHQIVRDAEGNIVEISKSAVSIPKYIRYGIETRKDWEIYKNEHLDYTNPERIGPVKKIVEEAHKNGLPVRFPAGSLYGWLRNWMGVENLSITIMTERNWVEEMMEHLTEMTLYLIEKALQDVEIDMAWWWEDMCYNHGPLISPKIFEELMVPRYKRITKELKKHNIDINILDCDGNIHQLVQGWLESGINCMFPIEVAHTDIFFLREKYGKDILLFGGVNKLELAKNKDAICREIERLAPLIKNGGYIPTVDHRVPPDVSLENYIFYLEKKKEILKLT